MILYEHEGKHLLFESGLNIPREQILESPSQDLILKPPLVLKAQVLSGKRAEAGGIIIVEDEKNLKKELEDLFDETINKEKVEKVLVEEKINILKEVYLSLSYDTNTRSPVLNYSQEGGTDIENRQVQRLVIDCLDPFQNLPPILPEDLLKKIITSFFEMDCLLLEINPLVLTDNDRWMALDAKIKLDDDARFRHDEWANFPPRGAPGYKPTEKELEAKLIDVGDFRGVAGSTYFELPGDIAVLSSGGGVSLTAMDALIAQGGKPANYTEYSGNPPKEKVTRLTKIVLSKPDIHGLWVIGTVAANFTDIYETLSGLIEGLREAQKELDKNFDFPIVIRRGGPREKEAYEMLKQVKDFDLHLYGEETSIAESAKIMIELAEEYKAKNNI